MIAVPDLDGVRLYIDWANDGFTSADEVDEVLGISITIGCDMAGQRVASIGSMLATLDNSNRAFSPKNASGPHYSSKWVYLPVKVEVDIGVSTVVLFTGRTVSFTPASNLYGDRTVELVCEDKLAEYQSALDLVLPLQADVSVDYMLKLIGSSVYRTDSAEASATFTGQPSASDTVTIGEQTYTFVSTLTGSSAYDVLIGTDYDETAANLIDAINGFGDTLGEVYASGTIRNTQAAAVAYASGVITLRAIARGTWGNSITLSESASNFTVGSFSGGVDGPSSFSYDTGIASLEYAGDKWSDGHTNAITAITDLMQNEWGWFAINNDGEPVFKNRDYIFLAPSGTSYTVDNTHLALTNPRISREDLYNSTSVQMTPRTSLAFGTLATGPRVIKINGTEEDNQRWEASSGPPGPETVVIRMMFRDPTSGKLCAASSVSPLEPGVHYSVNDSEDGTGFDYTNARSITMSSIVGADFIEITFTSTATGPLYVLDLFVEGVALVAYDAQFFTSEDTDSIDDYGISAQTVILPFPTDPVFPDLLAKYLTNSMKDPQFLVDTIDFDVCDNVSSEHMFKRTLFDILKVSDDQLDISEELFMIIGATYNLSPGSPSSASFVIQNISNLIYWILEDTDSELGVNTRLGL